MYAEAEVLITVIRNKNAPRFTDPDAGSLQLTVLETSPVGFVLYHVNASDVDGVSMVNV